MNKKEVNQFIKEMQKIGDEWTPEQVESVYGEDSLADAINDRKGSLDIFFDIIGKVINK